MTFKPFLFLTAERKLSSFFMVYPSQMVLPSTPMNFTCGANDTRKNYRITVEFMLSEGKRKFSWTSKRYLFDSMSVCDKRMSADSCLHRGPDGTIVCVTDSSVSLIFNASSIHSGIVTCNVSEVRARAMWGDKSMWVQDMQVKWGSQCQRCWLYGSCGPT